MTACGQCGTEFIPRRSTATYCSPRCRLLAHRGLPSNGLAERPGKALRAEISVSGTAPSKPAFETLKPLIWCGSKAASKLDRRIVSDAKYPGMYRLHLPGGGLSDMVNLTRAKDALLWTRVG
jgi:hypothetical protein